MSENKQAEVSFVLTGLWDEDKLLRELPGLTPDQHYLLWRKMFPPFATVRVYRDKLDEAREYLKREAAANASRQVRQRQPT